MKKQTTKATSKTTLKKSARIKPGQSGEGTVRPVTVHVYQVPTPKIGESVLFLPGAHDTVFQGHGIDRFSATISNVLGDGKVNMHVFADGPDRYYRTNIAHRSLAEKGASSWEWVESM